MSALDLFNHSLVSISYHGYSTCHGYYVPSFLIRIINGDRMIYSVVSMLYRCLWLYPDVWTAVFSLIYYEVSSSRYCEEWGSFSVRLLYIYGVWFPNLSQRKKIARIARVSWLTMTFIQWWSFTWQWRADCVVSDQSSSSIISFSSHHKCGST